MDALLKVLLLIAREYFEILCRLSKRMREESCVFVTVSLRLRLIFLIYGNNKDNELA